MAQAGNLEPRPYVLWNLDRNVPRSILFLNPKGEPTLQFGETLPNIISLDKVEIGTSQSRTKSIFSLNRYRISRICDRLFRLDEFR